MRRIPNLPTGMVPFPDSNQPSSGGRPAYQIPTGVAEMGRFGKMIQRPVMDMRNALRIRGRGTFGGSPTPTDGRDPGVGPKDPRYFDENGLPIADGQSSRGGMYGYGVPRGMPGGSPTGLPTGMTQLGQPGSVDLPDALDDVWGNGADEDTWDGKQYGIDGISSPSNRRSNDPTWWQGKMDELRGMDNFVDPTQDWGDDDWMDFYEPGDSVNVKADGNPHFGQAWDGDSWEDIDPNDASVASMFAESLGWEDDYQQGLREAWTNNDETAFQRWRNLARAYETSKWQTQQPQTPATPTTPAQPSRPNKPNKPAPPKAPGVPTPVAQPDPWRKKQHPIY